MGAIIVAGLVSGSIYALVASGLSLVWGALGVFNFAHGALLMVGAFVAWWLSDPSGLDLPLAVAILASTGFMIVAGAAVYALLVRPWLGQDSAELTVIMTTIAAAMFLENLALLLFGGRLKAIDQVVTGTITVGGTAMQAQNLLVTLLAPALLGALAAFLKLSKYASPSVPSPRTVRRHSFSASASRSSIF